MVVNVPSHTANVNLPRDLDRGKMPSPSINYLQVALLQDRSESPTVKFWPRRRSAQFLLLGFTNLLILLGVVWRIGHPLIDILKSRIFIPILGSTYGNVLAAC
jgi:hypothetical protein